MPRGRHKKPTALLKLHGQYDHDRKRYADREHEPQPVGGPDHEGKLTGAALAFWNRYVPGLVGTRVATSADSAALIAISYWWAEFIYWQKVKRTDPHRSTKMATAHKQWRDLASRFGMTPSDRANIQVENGISADPAAEFVS